METVKAPSSQFVTAARADRPAQGADVGERLHRSVSVSGVARGGVVAFFVYGTGIGLTFGSQLVIARLVGVDTYGIYAYVFAWMVVLAYFSALGFDVAILRFVPAYEAERTWPLLQGVIQYAQRRTAFVGLSVIIVGTCLVTASAYPPVLRNTFLAGFVLVPILALVWIRCSVVSAFGGVISALMPDRVVRDGMLVLLSIATLGLGWTIDAPLVMLTTLASATMGLGFTGLAIRLRRPLAIRDSAPVYDAPTWRRAALPLVIIGAAEALLNRTGVILLGWLADTKDAGIYGLAFNIAFAVMVPRTAVNTLFAPAISGLYARNDKAMMQVLVTRAALWTFGAGVCIALALFILAKPLLGWFGPGYEAGVPALPRSAVRATRGRGHAWRADAGKLARPVRSGG